MSLYSFGAKFRKGEKSRNHEHSVFKHVPYGKIVVTYILNLGEITFSDSSSQEFG